MCQCHFYSRLICIIALSCDNEPVRFTDNTCPIIEFHSSVVAKNVKNANFGHLYDICFQNLSEYRLLNRIESLYIYLHLCVNKRLTPLGEKLIFGIKNGGGHCWNQKSKKGAKTSRISVCLWVFKKKKKLIEEGN